MAQLIVNGENLNQGPSDTVIVYRDNLGRYSIQGEAANPARWKPTNQTIESGRGFPIELEATVQMINILRDNGWEYLGVQVLAQHQPNRPGEYIERAWYFKRLWRTRPQVRIPKREEYVAPYPKGFEHRYENR